MGRCRKERCCRFLPDERVFKAVGVPMNENDLVEIEPDEFEALRICDLEGKHQGDAAEQMKVSRGTVQRTLSIARKKVMEALLEKKPIRIKTNESGVKYEDMPSNIGE